MTYRGFSLVLAGFLATSLSLMPVMATSPSPNDTSLDFNNRQDFEDAKQGLIAPMENQVIYDAAGHVVWDLKQYAFLSSDTPATVNRSLWRQSQLNMNNGLFKVTDKVYQARGFDLSVMTLIQGDKGWIIVDPLTTSETAQAALSLANKQLGERPVVAVIYTHSHVDHFGGVRGVVDEKNVQNGQVRIIAPEGFTEHAIKENVYAGNAMFRRSSYMYGNLLSKSATGQVDAGLGKTVAAGSTGLILPTEIITAQSGDTTIDGIKFVFQYVPNTEAPAEIMFYLPQLHALCAAEDATHTMHNLYTLRGAEVRDALAWTKALAKTIDLFGKDVEVVFASHHWPCWGNGRILEFLEKQRDLYKFIHDQTLHLVNQGYTSLEIAEMLKLPPSLANEFYNRGYYGTLNHNVKAVYQKYIGFFDGNPATLHQLPPVESGKKYIEYMGGAQAVMQKAQASYDKGEYRWVAQVLNHVVFADPSNKEARELEAKALEKMGYEAESGPWRNFYLSGAQELRDGVNKTPLSEANSADIAKAMPLDMFLDYLAVRLNAQRAEGKKYTINIEFTDINRKAVLSVNNSVLNYALDRSATDADVSVKLNRFLLGGLVATPTKLPDALSANKLVLIGKEAAFQDFLSLFDNFDPRFNIVTP